MFCGELGRLRPFHVLEVRVGDRDALLEPGGAGERCDAIQQGLGILPAEDETTMTSYEARSGTKSSFSKRRSWSTRASFGRRSFCPKNSGGKAAGGVAYSGSSAWPSWWIPASTSSRKPIAPLPLIGPRERVRHPRPFRVLERDVSCAVFPVRPQLETGLHHRRCRCRFATQPRVSHHNPEWFSRTTVKSVTRRCQPERRNLH